MPATDHLAPYQGTAGQDYHGRKRGIPDAAVSWVAALRAEKLREFLRPGDVIYEHGVGSGWNLAQLNCRRRVGSDIATFLAPAVEKLGIEFIPDPKNLSDGFADVVLCHHVLEHVLHPAETLGELRRLLKEGGRLLLHVPLETERRYRHHDRAEPNHHLHSWNAQTLGNLVEACGFRVDQAGVGEFGYDRFAAVWAARLHLGERGFRMVRRAGHWLRPAREVRIAAWRG